MDFLDNKTLLTIVHLFGVALGVGGALMSDAMFFSSIKDESFSHTEVRFLKLGGAMVWLGIVVLVLSGIGLFLQNPSGYLASSKFLAKMTVVGVIIVNGAVFHSLHIPRIVRHVAHHFPSSDEFTRKSKFLAMSGAISMTSWVFALVLGALRDVPFGYLTIVGVYFAAIALACALALALTPRFLKHPRGRRR